MLPPMKRAYFLRLYHGYTRANPGPASGHREAVDAEPAVFFFCAYDLLTSFGQDRFAGIGIACEQAAETRRFLFPGPNNVKEVPRHGKGRRTGEDHPEMQ